MKLFSKIFGSSNSRKLKKLKRSVIQISALEEGLKSLDDDQLKAKTAEFQSRIQAGESVDSLLIEAFAVAREASVRVLGMRHFDVQLIGGMVLNEGSISEMRTG